MRKILTLSIIALLFFGCSSENAQEPEVLPVLENSSKTNLAIGIKKDADLSLVFKTLNELHFDIRQMNGFLYKSDTPESDVASLRNLLNEKPYIKTSGWSATTSSVFYYQPENKTYIINSFFDMNVTNQTDLLNLISSLKLKDGLNENKNIYLSIPEGTETHWKSQMMAFSFVKWTETFDQVCISYENAPIVSAKIPVSGNVNQIIPIDISFFVRNGCGGFGSITEINSGNTKTITVKAKYEGCLCTQSTANLNTTYNFSTTTTGTHTIKFLQPDGSFLTYSINIQ
ncbi:hypothetical protein EV144_104342 [Flavobacterium sp. 270]|uniref:hypothetical protein n=1 Tax=Flavobacterium sp. 270 TaxID=2512114 RepID=UPI0010652AA7|nr:hypothetical protein [Flavobacterium sp. 270]TDW48056.1 hypothetical protein EV144_104342 [Flavobacterium sp. 270]